jgi:hypothetical protein
MSAQLEASQCVKKTRYKFSIQEHLDEQSCTVTLGCLRDAQSTEQVCLCAAWLACFNDVRRAVRLHTRGPIALWLACSRKSENTRDRLIPHAMPHSGSAPTFRELGITITDAISSALTDSGCAPDTPKQLGIGDVFCAVRARCVRRHRGYTLRRGGSLLRSVATMSPATRSTMSIAVAWFAVLSFMLEEL